MKETESEARDCQTVDICSMHGNFQVSLCYESDDHMRASLTTECMVADFRYVLCMNDWQLDCSYTAWIPLLAQCLSVKLSPCIPIVAASAVDKQLCAHLNVNLLCNQLLTQAHPRMMLHLPG